MVMLGTKWPSITSTWIQSAPAASIASISAPSLEKSAERIEGAIRTGLGHDRLSAGFWSGLQGPAISAKPPRSSTKVGSQITRDW